MQAISPKRMVNATCMMGIGEVLVQGVSRTKKDNGV